MNENTYKKVCEIFTDISWMVVRELALTNNLSELKQIMLSLILEYNIKPLTLNELLDIPHNCIICNKKINPSDDLWVFCNKCYKKLARGRKRKRPSKKEVTSFAKKLFKYAIRYAHGRHTYAPSIVRENYYKFKRLFKDFKLEKDKAIKIPTEEALKSPIALRSDWLDDLFT